MEWAIQASGEYETVLAAARFAEERGLAAVALPDHYLMGMTDERAWTTPANDAFIQLGALARDTESIQLVVLVSPITFRHPAVLAKSAITIDRISGGRFSLGVGTGWMDREHEVFGFPYPPFPERFTMLEEALGYLRAAFDPAFPGFEGDHYRLEPFPLTPPPSGDIRLVVGGTGPHKTPRLAGRFADEFNVYAGKDLGERIARARKAAAETGRDPEALLISSAGQVIGADTREELEAVLEERAAAVGASRERLERSLTRRRSPVGTWEELAERFASMEAAGVRRFYLQGGYDPAITPELLVRLGMPSP